MTKTIIALVITTIATMSLAGMYFDKKDSALITTTYGYTNVSIKWTEGNADHTKHYVHYTNSKGAKCANVFYVNAEGVKAQPWEICEDQ